VCEALEARQLPIVAAMVMPAKSLHMYVYACVRVHARMCVRACARACICACVFVCEHRGGRACVHAHVCVFKSMCQLRFLCESMCMNSLFAELNCAKREREKERQRKKTKDTPDS